MGAPSAGRNHLDDSVLILLPFVALLGGMLLELLGAGLLSARAKGWLALVSALAALGGVLAAWPRLLAGHALEASFAPGTAHPLGLPCGRPVLPVRPHGGRIGTAVLLYSISYMARERGATRFYALILLFIAGSCTWSTRPTCSCCT